MGKINISEEILNRKSEQYGDAHHKVFDYLQDKKNSLKRGLDNSFSQYFSSFLIEKSEIELFKSFLDEASWIMYVFEKKKRPIPIANKHYGTFIHQLQLEFKNKIVACSKLQSMLSNHDSKSQRTEDFDGIFDELTTYSDFIVNQYVPYTYSNTVSPVVEGDDLYLYQSPADYYQKWLNECRFNIFITFAKLEAMKSRTDSPTGTGIDDAVFDILLESSALSELVYPINGNLVNHRSLLAPIRYFVNESKSTKHPLSSLNREQYDSQESRKDWVCFDDFCAVFSHEFNDQRHFSPELKPFVKIGDVLLCPSVLLAEYDLTYSFIQLCNLSVTLSKDKSILKKYTEKLECRLCDVLRRNPRWKIIHNPNGCANHKSNCAGDADIIVSDDKDILLIQVKKQNFSTNEKNAAANRVRLDEHGAKQLNDFEESHSSEYAGLNVTKWIVSSFEDCGTEINGCKKISYLDLVFWQSTALFDSLAKYILSVESDQPLQDIVESVKAKESSYLTQELGKALPIEDPLIYMTALRLSEHSECDMKRFSQLTSEFDKIFDTDNVQRLSDIKKEVLQLNERYPNNHLIWQFIGMMQKNGKELAEAEKSFLKVLEIIPNEPLTMKMLCLLYLESAKENPKDKTRMLDKCGEIKKAFRTKYWFVDENVFLPLEMEKAKNPLLRYI